MCFSLPREVDGKPLVSQTGTADFNPRGALAPHVGSKAEALRGLKPAVRAYSSEIFAAWIAPWFDMRIYRRRLPHRDVPGVPVFVTWSLWGSLPPERVFRREHLLSSGQAFAAWDRLLDNTRDGARHLAKAPVASVVIDKILAAEAAALCSLDTFVVMPNHVHVLWTPMIRLPDLVQRVKGPAAVEANRILGLTGHRFWQEEYFDRLAKTDQGRLCGSERTSIGIR